MRILDTDVAVDAIRGFPAAIRWLALLPEEPGLAGIAMMELVRGCGNKAELWRIQKMMARYVLYWPSAIDCQLALAHQSQLHFSHSLGLEDALIAATAIGQGATLCTFNVKHFRAVPGLVTEQPYSRT